jgi:hypothetical protein
MAGQDVTTAQLSRRQRIILDELAGKNFAAQSYDSTIWRIRSGFLTLAFGAWGAVIAALGDKIQSLQSVAIPLCILTIGLAIAGLALDFVYLRRKYRCISLLNEFHLRLYTSIDKLESISSEDWGKWLRFSGDDRSVDPVEADGFKTSLLELIPVYVLPSVTITLAVFILTN